MGLENFFQREIWAFLVVSVGLLVVLIGVFGAVFVFFA